MTSRHSGDEHDRGTSIWTGPGVVSPGQFASVLGEAMTASGVSIRTLQRELAAAGHSITSATISYWRSGRSSPGRAESRELLADLERILGMPRGALELTLQSQPLRGRAAAQAARAAERWPAAFEMQSSGVDRARELGLVIEGRLVREFTSITATFTGPERQVRWTRFTVWRSLIDGVDRFPWIFGAEEAPGELTLLDTAFCEVAALHYNPDTLVTIFDVRFPTRLRAGQRIATEVSFSMSEGTTMTHPQISTAYCSGPASLALQFVGHPAPPDLMSHWRADWVSPPQDMVWASAVDGWVGATTTSPSRILGFSWTRPDGTRACEECGIPETPAPSG